MSSLHSDDRAPRQPPTWNGGDARADAEGFVDALYGQRRGFAFLGLGRDGRFNDRGTYTFPKGCFVQRSYLWPDDREKLLEEALAEAETLDVYLAALLFAKPDRHKRYALPAPWAWAEIDHASLAELAEFESTFVGPGGLVIGSGHGHHDYLSLPEELNPAEIEALNRRLAARIGADSSWDVSRYLRLVGSWNHKDRARGGSSTQVVLLDGSRALHDLTLAELDHMLPSDPQAADAAARPQIPDGLPAHIERRVRELPGDDRSAQSYALVAACLEWGLSDEETVEVLLLHTPTSDKYGVRARAEIERELRKLRLLHDHVGIPCDRAACPNAPTWMSETARGTKEGRRESAATKMLRLAREGFRIVKDESSEALFAIAPEGAVALEELAPRLARVYARETGNVPPRAAIAQVLEILADEDAPREDVAGRSDGEPAASAEEREARLASLEELAGDLLRCPNVLQRFRAEVAASGWVGETTAPELVYLNGHTALLDVGEYKPVRRLGSLRISGPSSAGKNWAVDRARAFLPHGLFYPVTASSERALVYSPVDLRRRFLYYPEGAALHSDGIGAAILRSFADPRLPRTFRRLR